MIIKGNSWSDVMFSNETSYKGRNGYGRCIGIQVSIWKGVADLYPITSKRESTSSCNMEIPLQDLAEFSMELGPLSLVLESPALKDRLPLLIGLDDGLDRVLEKIIKGE